MGYTHYFQQKSTPTTAQWESITVAFRQLQAVALLTKAFPIQKEEDSTEPPVINDSHVIFNGIGKDAHETMCLQRLGTGFQFCKTARKPYDNAVMALLILANAYAPACWEISSDGESEDWQPTLDWMNTSGLGPFVLPIGIAYVPENDNDS